MQLLHSIFYHASYGFVEALPAGIIAVDISDTRDLTDNPAEVARELTSFGAFDDAAFLLGFTNEDADLVRGSADSEQFHYVVSSQLVPDYQWAAIKREAKFRIYELKLEDLLDVECEV